MHPKGFTILPLWHQIKVGKACGVTVVDSCLKVITHNLLHWPTRGHILVQIIDLCFQLSCTILLYTYRNADSFERNTWQPTLLAQCKHCKHFSSYNIVDVTIIVKHISKSFVIFHVVLDNRKQILKTICNMQNNLQYAYCLPSLSSAP